MTRLALGLGYPHPNKMFQDLTPDEILDMLAYYYLEPFGEMKEDWRMANQMALLANIHRQKGKRFKPKDFLPRYIKPRPRPEDVADSVYNALQGLRRYE